MIKDQIYLHLHVNTERMQQYEDLKCWHFKLN